MFRLIWAIVIGLVLIGTRADAQSERVVDIPTRSNVTQRFLFSSSSNAKAALILIAGGQRSDFAPYPGEVMLCASDVLCSGVRTRGRNTTKKPKNNTLTWDL
jgi:hypothetical protein